LSNLKEVSAIYGDLDNMTVLEEGVRGCDTVFHLAAYAKPWSKDKTLSYRVNVTGTENLLKASQKEGIKRFIFTSSAAVIGPSPATEPVDEEFARTVPYYNEYETTKAEAEELVRAYGMKGMETVIVNPPRVYGPGPVNESNSLTRIIKLYYLGKWRIMPGNGKCIGNYVLVDDVVNGHLLAALKGKSGERYILGGENLTFKQFFDILSEVTGRRRKLISFPVWLMIAVASIMEWQANITGIPPLITASWVKKYLNHWCLSSEKAVKELGYSITPFSEGAKKTIDWLKKNGELK
ncbi:MAG: NAD-dependent epimerase/dehydratase family protein, partial [Bacteroidales bacterium]|nr:NAD-dependent epimerase/dehydratase family protein [Bacteroidales bacterium]